jgi:co-chaperonin GroES (HSP10)
MKQPFGKTYLVKCEKPDYVTNEGGIFVVNESQGVHDVFWKGIIIEYGLGWTEEEKRDLVPIGSTIIMSYGKNSGDQGGTKLVIENEHYYIRDANEILGIIEDEE